jgi:hypothetical protein
LSTLQAGLETGEWRALDALVNRVLGKPTEHVKHEHEHAGQVTVEAVRAMTSEQRRALLAQARALPPMVEPDKWSRSTRSRWTRYPLDMGSHAAMRWSLPSPRNGWAQLGLDCMGRFA